MTLVLQEVSESYVGTAISTPWGYALIIEMSAPTDQVVLSGSWNGGSYWDTDLEHDVPIPAPWHSVPLGSQTGWELIWDVTAIEAEHPGVTYTVVGHIICAVS